VSGSPHKIRLNQPLKQVRVRLGTDSFVSEGKFREVLEERYRDGYEAGQKALSEQLIEQRKQIIDIQNGLLRSIQAALPGVIADCERSVVLLAIESARKVVESIPITAEAMEEAVQRALTELQDTAEYEVLLHPDDLKLLETVQSGLLPRENNGKVRFGIDGSVTRGGCVVKTKHGAISALREKMFEKLETTVLA
jgi:flagellar biosynthesis/type III secretory pathway protein FliH